MNLTNRRLLAACCTMFVALGTARNSWAGCSLTDWLFGTGHTTYAAPYCPPTVYAPPAQSGCAPAPCAATCQTCAPATTYRIAYRPVPTVTYMPVTATDPCSGCAVTTYRPMRAWTYYGSLVPYQVGYAAPVCPTTSCGAISNCCGYAPPSGYSMSCPCTSVVPMGGCSSCCSAAPGGYVPSSGCSSCTASPAVLPGPAEMSQPPIVTSPAPTLGAPAAAPNSGEIPRTYPPGTVSPPIAPGAPAAAAPNGNSADVRGYRPPTANDASHTIEVPRIQGVPPLANGPQLGPSPAPRPEGADRLTARPVPRSGYFQLLPPPPATVPVQTVGLPIAAKNLPADDAGWVHVEK
jgi:hypothetical protein